MKITELFERGEFVVSAEVGPPKGIHIDGLIEGAKEHLSGITAVNVTDNQSSVMRLGSLADLPADLPGPEPDRAPVRYSERGHVRH